MSSFLIENIQRIAHAILIFENIFVSTFIMNYILSHLHAQVRVEQSISAFIMLVFCDEMIHSSSIWMKSHKLRAIGLSEGARIAQHLARLAPFICLLLLESKRRQAISMGNIVNFFSTQRNGVLFQI